ncbi:MAG: outer membrane beta-barrel protein [Bacteroidota bacterium]
MKKAVLLFLLTIVVALGDSFAQRKTTGIDIKFGIQSPVFNFDNLYNTGYGFYFGGLFPFGKYSQFTIYSGYLNWEFDNEALNLRNTNQNYTDFNIKAPINLVPLVLGVKLYAADTKVKPYLSADFGFFYFWQITSGTYTWRNEISSLPNQKESGFRTMLSLGAGVITPLTKKIDLDFQIKLNGLYNAQAVSGTSSSGQINESSSTLYYLSFMIGLNYYFEN